jgi:glycosyltransferase involved in cell wall biosynthesis
MKVLISSFGRFHTYQMLDALVDNDLESSSIVCDYKVPTNNKNLYKYKFILKYWFILAKLPYVRFTNFIKNIAFKLFDRFVGLDVLINDYYVVHAYSLYALSTFKTAKRKNTITVLERAGSHPSYQKKVLVQEYQKLGISMPLKLKYYLDLEERMIDELSYSDYVVTCSNYTKSTFLQYGIKENKIKVLPLGSNDLKSLYNTTNIEKNLTFTVLFVGTQPVIKGLYYLLEAINLFKEDEINLVIVSDIDSEFKEKYSYLLNKPNITIYNKLNWQELAKEYAKAKLFCLPSIDEAFGMVVLEAVSFGIPVIVSDHVGAAEVVTENNYGLVFKSKNINDLYNNITVMLNDCNQYNYFVKSCSKSVSLNSWGEYGHKLVGFYKEIL